VESSDIFPTLCALAGIKVPETVQGRAFTRIFDQPGIVFRESAYSRFVLGDAIVTENFSYTRYADDGAEMLYDLRSDPHENSNVSGHSTYRETVEQMRTLLKQRQDESTRFGTENSPGKTGQTKT
jgi:arylsulfatase A-like enzyme